MYDPDATDWDGLKSPEHWWEDDHTDLAVVERMVSQAIRGVAGTNSDAAAWDAIFRHFNEGRGRGDVGYQAGQKIAIKINLTACNATWGNVDGLTYRKIPTIMNTIDNSPQMILALLRQLVNTVGAEQGDITVGDPTGMIPSFYWDMLHPEFPKVHYLDNYGGSGRLRAEFSDVPLHWSTDEARGKLQDYLPRSFAEADYLINFAILKGHSSGVTLCAKAHVGQAIYNTPTTLAAMAQITSPAFGIDMDPSHIHRAGEDPAAALAQVLTRVKHVHIRDCPGRGPKPGVPAQQACGRGDIDLFAYCRAMVEGGYNGPVSLEVIGAKELELPEVVAIAAESYGYLNACLKALGAR